MSIAQNSIFLQFFITLWSLLRTSWETSLPGRIFARVGLAIRHGVAGSALCQFVWRDGRIVAGWPESLVCRVLMAILNVPVAIVGWIYEKGKNLFDNSFLFRLGSALGGATSIFVGLTILIMLIVPHSSWINGYALRCMMLVTLLFFVGCAGRKRWRLELDTLGPYYTVFMGFIVYGFLGSLATNFSNGILYGLTSEAQNVSLRFFIFYIISFLIVIVAVSAVHKTADLQLMVTIAVAGLVVAALYGCYQGYQGVEVVANQQDFLLNKGMPGRVFSFFDNPNNFGEILVILMPFELALLLNAKGWRGRALALASMVPCLVAIGMTYFRSGWIGLTVAVLVFLVLLNWRFLPLFIVLGLAALPFLPESIMNRILTIGNMNDSSLMYRFAIYGDTVHLIEDYGVRGVGLGTDVMQQVFKVYPTMYDGHYPIHTHNNYLQMWGELGIFGAISYLALVLSQLKRGVKAFYSGTDRAVKNILAAAISAFCGICVIGLAEYTWFYPRNMFIWWFLFAVITASVKLLKKKG